MMKKLSINQAYWESSHWNLGKKKEKLYKKLKAISWHPVERTRHTGVAAVSS